MGGVIPREEVERRYGNVRAAMDEARVDAVVVAGSEVDRTIGPGEAFAQEGDRVGREALVLEQVAGAEHGVDLLIVGQLEDPGQRLAAIPAPEACCLRPRPGEWRIQVQVGEMQDPHDSQA